MKIPQINNALGKNIIPVQDANKDLGEEKNIDQNSSSVPQDNNALLKLQIKNLSESRDKLLESGALEKKIKEEHVSLYNDFRLLFEKHDWHGLLQDIANTTCKLINEGASPNGLKLFFESTVYNLLTGRQLWDIRASFPSLIKAKPNKEQWRLFEEVNDYYKKRSFKIDALPFIFSRLIESEPTPLAWDIYKTAVAYYKKKGLKIDKFTKDFTELVYRNPTTEQLEVFKDIISFYMDNKKNYYLNQIPGHFSRLIWSKPSNENFNLYKDIIANYKEYKWQLNTFTWRFADFVVKDSSEDKLENKALKEKIELFKDVLSSSKDNKFNVDYVDFSRINDMKFTPHEWQVFKELIAVYKNRNWNPDYFVKNFCRLVKESPTPLILETLKNVIAVIPQKYDVFFHCNVLECFISMAEGKVSPTLLKTFNQGLQNGIIKPINPLLKALQEMAIHTAIVNLIGNDPEGIKDFSRTAIQDIASSDSLPYARVGKSLKAQKMYNETLEVYNRAFNSYHGFSSLTFETKRSPTKEPPLLARFGRDTAQSIKYLNAKDITLFPGRGFLISGPVLEKIFAIDKQSIINNEDPFHRYKTAWPWSKEIFDDLSKTHFLFTRGMIAVSCPGDPKYELEDSNGKKINYSYVVFNDHHHNYGFDAAFLVPTEVLRKKLNGTTIPYENYTGPSLHKDIKDINEAGFKPEDLINEAKAIPANVLNLCWGSNIGGGLCNAYPVGSTPYHEWEKSEELKDETKDIYEHIHKSHMTGTYESHMTKELRNKLIPLRKAHDEVYMLTNRYQNLLDLFKLSLAKWHKGETLGEAQEPLNETDDDLFKKTETKFEQFLKEEALDDMEVEGFNLNPNANRMLVEAYKWHKEHESEKANPNDFPILVLANALDWWTKPESPFMLDTFDMSLTINDQKIQLPQDSNGIQEEELKIWHEQIIPYLRDSKADLRFYDRRDLELS